MVLGSRKKTRGIECGSYQEIKTAVKTLGPPVVLGVGHLIAGEHNERYFVHRKSEILEQVQRAFDASNSPSLTVSTRGRVTVKKLLND